MAQPRIMIVDDEQNIARTLVAAFAQSGYHTEAVNDGTIAWQKLSSEQWDILFLDIRLPGMDGMEILKHIYDNKLPVNVVMITAYPSIGNAVQAMKYGAVDFLPKPLEPAELRSIVSRILERRNLNEHNAQEYDELIELTKLRIREREYRLAHAAIKKAIDKQPGSAEAYNLLGAIDEVLGDVMSAAQAYQMSLSLDSSYLPAAENLKRLTSLEGNSASLMDYMAAHKFPK